MSKHISIAACLLLVLATAGPAAAAHGGNPGLPQPPPPDERPPCAFDADGVLVGWDGSTDELYICLWAVEERPAWYTFHMEGHFRNPYLGVKDAFLPEGDLCFVERGLQQWYDAYEFTTFHLPENGVCGDRWDDTNPDRFALMISVQRATGSRISSARLCLSECPATG